MSLAGLETAYRCETCEQLQEALSQEQPDALLVDLDLPGEEPAWQILARMPQKSSILLVLSGHSLRGKIPLEIAQLNPYAVISKPCQVSSLLCCLKEALITPRNCLKGALPPGGFPLAPERAPASPPPGREPAESGTLPDGQSQPDGSANGRLLHEQLEARQRTLQAILDSSPAGICYMEPGFTIKWCNRAMETITGYRIGELLGQPLELLFPNKAASQEAGKKALAVLQGIMPGPLRATWRRKEGSAREIQAYLEPQSQADLSRGFIATVMDITEHIQAQRDLAHRQKSLQAILDASPVGIIWMRDRVIQIVNPALCQMLGYKKNELEGRKSRMLYLSGQEYAQTGQAIQEELMKRAGASGEARWQCKDGRIINVLIQVRLLEPGRLQGGHIATVEDITERKATEKKLKEYQNKLRGLAAQLALAEERERQRLAEVVHDGLGQTLALIRIGLQAALAGKPRAREQKLHELVRQVDQAFAEARTITASLSPPILRELGLEAGLSWLAEHTYQSYGVVTQFTSNWMPKELDWETTLTLFRATQELVMNAVKHGHPRTIRIRLDSEPSHLEITVQDDGHGFDIRALDSFIPHGFGLFSIGERLKNLGGEGKIGSRPGAGTVASISLPMPEALRRGTN
ncbi:hypothetical protein AAU61_07075 [Desulfocarbo indianensis]|nr:hypothetical protein AAU61_07075 [Desulfocarbo indianensis]